MNIVVPWMWNILFSTIYMYYVITLMKITYSILNFIYYSIL